MSKNLIKINGVYNNLAGGEEHNIFCTMLVDFSDFNNILINIKNCQVENNLINFDEKYYNLKNDEIINNTLNIINNLKNNALEGEINIYLQNLINFLFQYIYNEYYIEGNFTFDIITLI